MRPLRLIDLHLDWLAQYAPETSLFPAGSHRTVSTRLGQVEGYLGATSAAVVWASADPDRGWPALGDLIARVEAEFSGRLLTGPTDLARWADDPDGLTWAVLGIAGIGPMLKADNDFERLNQLIARGVRVVRTAALGPETCEELVNSAVLERLAKETTVKVAIDLGGLDAERASKAIEEFEKANDRQTGPVPMVSLTGIDSAALGASGLARVRALGGIIGLAIGPPFFASKDAIREAVASIAALPFRGQTGPEGIALATNFLGMDRPIHGLEDAEDVVRWVRAEFDPPTARLLLAGNAETWIRSLVGGMG